MPTHPTLQSRLAALTNQTLQAAGPRYTPGITPDAPNLRIEGIHRLASALTMGTQYRRTVGQLAEELAAARNRRASVHQKLFARRRASFSSLEGMLTSISNARMPQEITEQLRVLRRHAGLIATRLESEQRQSRLLAEEERDRRRDSPSTALDQSISRLDGHIRAVAELSDALHPILQFAESAQSRVFTDTNAVLLVGDWGTGKTHFVCDFALEAIRDGTPALAVLANSLREDLDPLDAIAHALGMGADGSRLLDVLEAEACASERRALILVDAINEADRQAWCGHLKNIELQLRSRRGITLLVTCRSPFHEEMLTPALLQRFQLARHHGFENLEFDAQFEFFEYYKLPALNTPLITPEFSRPLFLKVMCRGLASLSKRDQRQKLRDIASGQKGMTFVLENFVKHVGKELEVPFGLAPKTCWLILKGNPGSGRQGIAGLLAKEKRDWLTSEEATLQISLAVNPTVDAAAVLVAMIRAGLLVEHIRYSADGHSTVVALPYQRFSDHLIARHLMDGYLDVRSLATVKRSLYVNRPLGAPFALNRRGTYIEPGIASALMIEFPERIKRLVSGLDSPMELIAYIPKSRQLLRPLAEVFIPGLYWRNHGSFSSSTERVASQLLTRAGDQVRDDLLDALTGLATRPTHPWNASYLYSKLSDMTLSRRDLAWSEYLRGSDNYSNARRVLAWHERSGTIDDEQAANSFVLLALMCTTSDRVLRDRATRALVLVGDDHPKRLFEFALLSLEFNDPYVSERVLAAAFGVAMRRWAALEKDQSFTGALATLARELCLRIFSAGAPNATWHSLSREYASGIVRLARILRPQLVNQKLASQILRKPDHNESPFRPNSDISELDASVGEDAIYMDFGNYTIGHLVHGRNNYDMEHPEYAIVRRQIADRIRVLGYSKAVFDRADKAIVRSGEFRAEEITPDRYGKKYSWIAYHEMYGFRDQLGLLDQEWKDPRSSDLDIDPTFPSQVVEWSPPPHELFVTSSQDYESWLSTRTASPYAQLLAMETIDGHAGPWTLVDASISEGSGDGREIRSWVSAMYFHQRSVNRVRHELRQRQYGDNVFPRIADDYYTFLGEVPWSPVFAAHDRNRNGTPRRLPDTAFNYYGGTRWRDGLRVEASSRHVGLESGRSRTMEYRAVVVPSLPFATFHNLRMEDGLSDMIDRNGDLATIFRRVDGPGYGSYYFYIRRDLLKQYLVSHQLQLAQSLHGERTLNYRRMDPMRDSIRKIMQAGLNDFDSEVRIWSPSTDEVPELL
jgi:DNA replication protein DnaC